MKLKDALEIGKECGLETVSEAILNIRIHAMSIFKYEEEQQEYSELIEEYKKYNLTQDELIDDVLLKIS